MNGNDDLDGEEFNAEMLEEDPDRRQALPVAMPVDEADDDQAVAFDALEAFLFDANGIVMEPDVPPQGMIQMLQPQRFGAGLMDRVIGMGWPDRRALAQRGFMDLFHRRGINNAEPVLPPPANDENIEDWMEMMDEQQWDMEMDEEELIHEQALLRMERALAVVAMHQQDQALQIPQSRNRFLFDLIREDLSCFLHTGNPNRNCQNIVRFCQQTPQAIHFVDDRTRRTPLHEAAIRCSCIHTIRALVETTGDWMQGQAPQLMSNDSDGNCPLQLYIIGMSRKSVMEMDSVSDVSNLLLGTPPNNIPQRQNYRGSNSLHLVFSAPESMMPPSIVETLLSRMTNGPAVPNSYRKTALHLHCDRPDASVDVARMLVENVPESTFSHDADGKTPMHYAAQRGNGPLVEYLIEAIPGSLSQTTNIGSRTILHLFKEMEPRTLQLVLQRAPELLARRDSDTLKTPLNTLLADPRLEVNPEIVRMMVDQDASILLLADQYGFLPIHYACQTGRETELVRMLLTAQTVAAVTLKSDTALSLAASQNSVLETVQMLIDAHSPALKKANDYGFLPLHCVCRAQRPKEAIIRSLIDAFPGARQLQTHAGELPLHLAHKGASKASLHILGNDENCVSALDTLVSKNKIGNTPLHSACLNLTNLDNIITMAEDHPEWLLTLNNAGFNPVQLLCRKGLINERLVRTIYNLVGVRPFESVDTFGHTPLHSAVGSGSEEAIRALIEVNPHALQVKTTYGDTPLHLACHRNVPFIGEIAKITCEKATQHGFHTSPLLIRNKAGQTPISIALAELKANYAPCFGVVQDYSQVAALIKILYYGTEFSEQGGLVAACLALHRRGEVLHPSFIRKVITDHPEEVRVPDNDGNYPLHVEASIPVEKMILLDGSSCVCGVADCHSRKTILKSLLEVFPEATKHNNKLGYSVLDLIMKNGRPWDTTFAFILRVNLSALHVIDQHELMPHLIARIGNGCGPTTLYSFLRARPDLIMKDS